MWWGRELASMIPASMHRWLRESDRIVLLQFVGENAIFAREMSGDRQEILTVALDRGNTTTQYSQIELELSQKVGQGFSLLLCLDADKVLRRTVTVPLAVEENLRQTLVFELDRFTPFKPDQVYFDFRVAERNASRRSLTLEIAVVQRTVLDQEMVRAAELGMRITGVTTIADKSTGTPEYFNLLPVTTGKGKWPSRIWMRTGLGSLSVLLLAAFLAIPIWQKRSAAISLLEPLAQAKAAAIETDRLRDELNKLVAEYNWLPEKKWGSASTLLVLDELTKLLKDDTFLMAFEFDGKTVQIQGESGVAAGLVELLDASPMFQDVAFKAQLTKIQGTSADRFHVVAALETEARPKHVSKEAAQASEAAVIKPSPDARLESDRPMSTTSATAAITHPMKAAVKP